MLSGSACGGRALGQLGASGGLPLRSGPEPTATTAQSVKGQWESMLPRKETMWPLKDCSSPLYRSHLSDSRTRFTDSASYHVLTKISRSSVEEWLLLSTFPEPRISKYTTASICLCVPVGLCTHVCMHTHTHTHFYIHTFYFLMFWAKI